MLRALNWMFQIVKIERENGTSPYMVPGFKNQPKKRIFKHECGENMALWVK